jgi:hypothetical protein
MTGKWISYYCLPELSVYWEQQPNSGNALGIIQRVRRASRERFRFISRHLTCSRQVDAEESFGHLGGWDPIFKIRPLVDVSNYRFQQLRQPPRFKASTRANRSRSALYCRVAEMIGATRTNSKSITDVGLETRKQARIHKNETTHQVVLDLCAHLANKGHIVAFDSFFKSISLMDKPYESGKSNFTPVNQSNEPSCKNSC